MNIKKVFALSILIITPTLASAQGSVGFNNNSTGLVKQWISRADSTLISVPKGGGYVQLIAAPKGTPLPHPLGVYDAGIFCPLYDLAGFLAANPGWAAATNYNGAVPVQITAADGVFSGGNYTIGNISRGAQADYLVIGWTGSYSTYDAAAMAAWESDVFLGVSAVATTSTADYLAIPPQVPVSLQTTFAGMTLAPTVFGDPPWFPVPPVSQAVTMGGTATFTPIAAGTPSPTLQWSHNGTNIPGATTQSYTITNAQYADAGTYTVMATSEVYYASARAMLQVLPPGGPSVRLDDQISVGIVLKTTPAQLTISGGFTNGSIFYTLDGSAPTTNSPLYTGPRTLTTSATIQAMSLSPDGLQVAVSPAVMLRILPARPFSAVLAGPNVGLVITGWVDLSKTYQIEYSPTLSPTSRWTVLTNLTLSQPVEMWVDSSVQNETSRYYRVTRLPY